MQYEIKGKACQQVKFVAEIDCEESDSDEKKRGLALLWAIENRMHVDDADFEGAELQRHNLSGVNLRGIYLRKANLAGCTLEGSYMRGANLGGAFLKNADLTDVNLKEAYMRKANLDGATLLGANLQNADLRNADLRNANLADSILEDADLRDADLEGANILRAHLGENNIRLYKHDMWGVLVQNRKAIPEFVEYLKDGKIDGSNAYGECPNILEIFAKITKIHVPSATYMAKHTLSPVAQWFTMIRHEDDPMTNYASKLALDWVNEFIEYQRV